MIREDPVTCKCGEIPQHPIPVYDEGVHTSLIVCSGHGASGVMEEDTGTTAVHVLIEAVKLHHKSLTYLGCEMLAAFFNIGTDQEFGVDFTEDTEGTILWQRCPDSRILATNGKNAMEGAQYHGSISLREWATLQAVKMVTEDK